ncbi:putative mitochondrial hypothetical protein [Leptomonas pyrrhocoris]|uniref:Uncharacterized protein n=1 Tax=Leptomonas pyrrhocoris TaxID=157538 RepID=A0A0N0DUA5_LEPPY|nr:putative mitochondrial hypothetical protein [Leptomonas pyrrhocoris]KPA78641.1 putative mitochondrial hypothetical protein [Leptomonas pyrrhocoris]|eukprot:XP_015657080.1 putative mitochondrial hypothetical protein [Leptomonas pyrrhocoris]
MRRLCRGILQLPRRTPWYHALALSADDQNTSARPHKSGFATAVAHQLRGYSGASESKASMDEGDEEDDFMQAYEDMLLNASSQDDDVLSSQEGLMPDARSSQEDDATTPEHVIDDGAMTSPSSSPSPAEAFIEEAYALLPADGSSVPLTELTPLLDLEAISESFGSARSFLQLFPHRFACTQDNTTRRWRVSRASVVSGSPNKQFLPNTETARGVEEARSHTELDVSEMVLSEELAQVRARLSSSHTPSAAPDRPPTSSAAVKQQSTSQDAHSKKRRTLTSAAAAAADATAGVEAAHVAVHRLWSAIALLLPENGSPMPIAQLRVLLPLEIVEDLRTRHAGLARCFKHDYDVAHGLVALTADSMFLLRRGTCADTSVTNSDKSSAPPQVPPLWAPPAASSSVAVITQHLGIPTERAVEGVVEDGVYVPVPADYIHIRPTAEAEAWWADVPLDDADDAEDCTADVNTNAVTAQEEVAAAARASTADEDAAHALAAATGLEEVPYDGLEGPRGSGATVGDASLLRGLDVALLRRAPVVPPRQTTAAKKSKLPASLAPSSRKSDEATPKKTRPPRPSTPEEWIALHTALANAHGWLTPAEMLDYLVECVPTFFVPIEEVRTSDALLKLVGPRTSMRTLLCRIFIYYVEKSEDGTQVRLAASVTHPQRGAADPHYAAWDPSSAWRVTAGSAEWHSDQAAEATKEATPSSIRAGSKLTASDTTKAFPVMHVRRPIKSALPSKLPRKRNVRGGTPSTFPAAMAHAADPAAKGVSAVGAPASTTHTEVQSTAGAATTRPLTVPGQGSRGGVPLSSIPVTDIGYPYLALATLPVEAWPWWARLLCVLPFDAYVSLEALATCYLPGLSAVELELAWRSSESLTAAHAGKGSPPHPFPFALLRPPHGGPRQVRLRPFWLAPGCTAELDAAVLPVDLARQLRPVWMAVPRVLKKLSAESQEATLAMALQRMPGVSCTAEEALLCLLRDCGRCCWVNHDGTKVRRYAASHEMDDIFHLSLSLLHGFSSAHAWEPVKAVLARAADHVRPLLKDQHTTKTESPYDVGFIGMLYHTPTAELQTFLQRHAQWIDVKAVSDAAGSGATVELLIRRRAAYVSFARENEAALPVTATGGIKI